MCLKPAEPETLAGTVSSPSGISLSRALFSLLLLSCLSKAWSLPEDHKKPIELKAGKVDFNQSKRLGIYSGNVEFDQGSTHLRSYRAMTQGAADNSLEKAAAYGNGKQQAHFWTLTALDKPELHAYADSILYFPALHRIELRGHAKVQQGENSFTAPVIVYNPQSQHVETEGNAYSRTSITLHPEKEHERISRR